MIEIDGAVPSPSLALADEPAFRVLMGRVTGDESIPIRPAYLLTAREARFAPSLDDVEQLPLTYFGGRPLVRRDEAWAWPRGADGRPLAFVLQVDLQHADEDNSFKGWVTESPHERLYREIGIPDGTLLQVFHDTETYGVPGEDDPRAWQVRFVPAPNEDDDRLRTWRLAAYPDDVPAERRRDPVHLHAEFAATIPTPLSRPTEGRSAQEVDGYWQLHNRLERYGYTQNLMRLEHILPPESDEQGELEPVEAPSRVGGFPSVPFDEDDDRELRRPLRLTDDLEPVLVAEIAPLPLGEGDWFHGGRPLQVWMHPDDLRGGVTERAWCQIRTDGWRGVT